MYKFRWVFTTSHWIDSKTGEFTSIPENKKMLEAFLGYLNYTFIELYTFGSIRKLKRIKDLALLPTGCDYWQRIN